MFSNTMKSLMLAILLILFKLSSSKENPVATNYTSQLLRQAKMAELLSYQSNYDVLCQNFYDQACGNWRKNFPASFDSPKTSHLGQIHQLYVSKSRDMLKNYQGPEVSHAFISKFYSSCANRSQIEDIGIKPVLNHFNFRGGWPLIQNMPWYEKEYDWLKTVADIRRDLGLNLFIGLEVKPIPNHYANMNLIQIGPPKFPLVARGKYLDAAYENERIEYKHTISEKLRKHLPNTTELWRQEVADQVLSVEISLAKGLSTENKNLTPVQQTIAQLKSKYATFVDFSRYLTLIFDRTRIEVEPVYELPSDYFTNLLKVIEHTPKLTIANYTIWHLLEHLDLAFDKNENDYEIWCTEQVIKYFPAHVESLYATEYKTRVDDKIGVLVRTIFGDIKKALEIKFGQVDKFTWMSSETRQKASEHFGRIIFAEEDTHELEEYLDTILYAIKSDQYYENLIKILQLETKRKLKVNTKGPSLEGHTLPEVPFYSSKHKEIVVPVEFLQTHFLYDTDYPYAINYGTVGVLLAQQLLRGLLANETSSKWWDNTTEVQFDDRKNCFAKQLGNNEFHGKPVDDKDGVLNFVIFTSGVEIAFDAYIERIRLAQVDRVTENLSNRFSYNNERLFFLSFAEMYCADYYIASFKKFTTLPERLLVKGALTNFAKFAETFNCASHTQMNTRRKCTIF